MNLKVWLLAIIVANFVVMPAANAEISDGVVKIGVLSDMNGPYADQAGPGSVIAAKMAVKDYKKQTGSSLNIEVVSADHQNKSDVGAAIARKWYDVEGVDAITDLTTSSVALAVNQITKDKNKVGLFASAATSELTGKACTPNTVHWTWDTWMLAHSTGSAVVQQGGDTWFFITADYAFGHDLEQETTEVVQEMGGEVLGHVRMPIGMNDFSSFILQAQSSKAKIIGLANAGEDLLNTVKQANEFGVISGGQRLAGLLVLLNNVHALGLESAQGLLAASPFYWDLNDGTRGWAKRFAKLNSGTYPNMQHAGVYASVLHYLKAVDEVQDDNDGAKVVEKMKEMPTDDPLFGKGEIRIDGRKTHPVYLFQVKSPEESKYGWDYYKLVETIPADKAFRPLNQGGCDLVNEGKS